MNLNVYIETYGCQMNEYDSELVKSILVGHGHALTDRFERADVVLINTCAIRERAHQKIYGRLQRLKHQRAARRTEITVGILGCMAQNLKQDLMDGHDVIDFVAGPDAYRHLPELIAASRGVTGLDASTLEKAALKLSTTETYSGVDPVRSGGVNAWIAVMRGCDNMCTFCVVPFTRGRERSRDPKGVVAEVEALVRDGFRQVTLLGQNVNSYRHGDVRFADLMRMVGDVPGVERVRFTSPHPKDFPSDLIKAIAGHPNLCKHIHLPLQAGNDRVLDLMRRTYSNAEFRALVDEMRGTIPNLGLTTDAIVGFPTETAAEFDETARLMQDVRFDAAFIFKYSERKGTYAQRKLADDVTPEEKTRRIVHLVEMQKEITREINRSLVGSTQEILVEETDPHRAGFVTGRTDNFKHTILPADGVELGDIVRVVIEDAHGATLHGRALEPARRTATG
ncbi:MAG: tRNA (N6-isopentenyl adenosine(37)-C2)-methylthiotransferase MiaB [Candidatus Krumholzibacteria bacterium]|nr:tRNA (N6-isopentenyl adenosine(37)-C2)-methylthiotransferase MiaB [Candidatus Krumholzibacteria bacterium]MDH4337423.1 tRNA (N6-isopentenyl adenosine(37)-C2)-methylthiotransferase MiaB [Candidatus Krumholzibacteria bacterium]MDH5271128.1 tRNA (N6-isopentenyl adenosine(37)-C2)-methylthiotransferase MiaB [Candidatus Krumholzibacteria bacterium]